MQIHKTYFLSEWLRVATTWSVSMLCVLFFTLLLIKAACVYVTDWRPGGNTDWQHFNCLIFNMDSVIKVQVCSATRQTMRPECSAEKRAWKIMKKHPRKMFLVWDFFLCICVLGHVHTLVGGGEVCSKCRSKHEDPLWTYERALPQSSPCSTPPPLF